MPLFDVNVQLVVSIQPFNELQLWMVGVGITRQIGRKSYSSVIPSTSKFDQSIQRFDGSFQVGIAWIDQIEGSHLDGCRAYLKTRLKFFKTSSNALGEMHPNSATISSPSIG